MRLTFEDLDPVTRFNLLATTNWLDKTSTRRWATTALCDPPPPFGSKKRSQLLKRLRTQCIELQGFGPATNWRSVTEHMISHARTQALLSPMRCLSTEIITEIISLVLADCSSEFADYARNITNAMLVCWRWRNICESNPRFWSRVSYGSLYKNCTTDGLGIWLRRSRSISLHVVLKLNPHLDFDFHSLLLIQRHVHRIRSFTLHINDAQTESSEDAVIKTFACVINSCTSLERLHVHGIDAPKDTPIVTLCLPKLRKLTWKVFQFWRSASLAVLQSASFTWGFPSCSMLRDICSSVEFLAFDAQFANMIQRPDVDCGAKFPLLKSIVLQKADHIESGSLLTLLQSVDVPIIPHVAFPRGATQYDKFLTHGLHERITEIHIWMQNITCGMYRESEPEDFLPSLQDLPKICSHRLERIYFETREGDAKVGNAFEEWVIEEFVTDGFDTDDLTPLLRDFLITEEVSAASPLCPRLKELHLTNVIAPIDIISRISGERSDQPNQHNREVSAGLVFCPCRVFLKEHANESNVNADNRAALAAGSWESFWRQDLES